MAHEIEFSWPDENILNEIAVEQSVYLKEVRFRTFDANDVAISWVQCTLSNGTKSPIFKGSGSDGAHYHNFAIELDEEKAGKIRSVHSQSNDYYLYGVTFKDDQDEIIGSYNPTNQESDRSYQVSQNQLIIGVYGAVSDQKHFNCLGFIVKEEKKPPNSA